MATNGSLLRDRPGRPIAERSCCLSSCLHDRLIRRSRTADGGFVSSRGSPGEGPLPARAMTLEYPDAALAVALRRFVRGRLDRHADGDDVVQETYLRLFAYQATAQVNDRKALCFAITRNLLLDHHRAARRSKPARRSPMAQSCFASLRGRRHAGRRVPRR